MHGGLLIKKPVDKIIVQYLLRKLKRKFVLLIDLIVSFSYSADTLSIGLPLLSWGNSFLVLSILVSIPLSFRLFELKFQTALIGLSLTFVFLLNQGIIKLPIHHTKDSLRIILDELHEKLSGHFFMNIQSSQGQTVEFFICK